MPAGGAFVREPWEGFAERVDDVGCAAGHLDRDVGLITGLGGDGDTDDVAMDLRAWGRHQAAPAGGSSYSTILVSP